MALDVIPFWPLVAVVVFPGKSPHSQASPLRMSPSGISESISRSFSGDPLDIHLYGRILSSE